MADGVVSTEALRAAFRAIEDAAVDPKIQRIRQQAYEIGREVERRRNQAVEDWIVGVLSGPAGIPLAPNNRTLARYPDEWTADGVRHRVALVGHDDPDRRWEDIDDRPKLEVFIEIKGGSSPLR